MTTTVLHVLENDNLRDGDLRNPLYHLLQQEKQQTPPTRRKSDSSAASSLSVSSSSAGKPTSSSNKRHFLPESVCQRVEQSWSLVSDDIEDLGLSFFLLVFEKQPELLTLLPYGRSYLETPPDQRKEKLRQCPSLRVHSIHVMTAVGNVIAGLNDMETVIPALRSLGKTHRAAGISDDNYKSLFKHLSEAIREKVGPSNWDAETSEAWELVYFSLASIMSRPATPLQAEPVTGWHELLVLASLYLAIATPFQIAGFTANVPSLSVIFSLLDTVAVVLFLIDLCSDYIIEALRVKPPRAAVERRNTRVKAKGKLRRRFDQKCTKLKVHVLRKLRSIQMDQWVSWPTTDMIVVGSFIVENTYTFLINRGQCSLQTSPSIAAGLHWIYALALLRLAAISRVFHALRCVENNLLLRQRLDQNERTIIRIAKLILTLTYVTHVSGCVWCIVARIELGPNSLEAAPTDFFPEPNILLGSSGTINSYFRSIHWAWTNLAGIGNFDSTPVTTLEVVITLVVHVLGVTFYAIMTGAVVGVLEELTSNDNELSRELSELGTFMNTCNVPPDVKKRIMEGFIMRRLVSSSGGASEDQTRDDTITMSAEIKSCLPKHLQKELTVYSRSESVQRRDETLQNCSADFLFALAGELQGSQMLLPGDYLLKEGETPRQVIVVDSGTLEVEVDGKAIKMLRQGDILGKPWLIKALDQNCNNNLSTISEEDRPDITPIIKHVPTAHSFSEWLDITDGCADSVKIRALSACCLATGLSSPHDVRALQKRFPKDFSTLQKEKERAIAAVQKVEVTRNIVRASMAFKRQLRHSPSA